jgi:hypothetical protein
VFGTEKGKMEPFDLNKLEQLLPKELLEKLKFSLEIIREGVGRYRSEKKKKKKKKQEKYLHHIKCFPSSIDIFRVNAEARTWRSASMAEKIPQFFSICSIMYSVLLAPFHKNHPATHRVRGEPPPQPNTCLVHCVDFFTQKQTQRKTQVFVDLF